MNKRIMILAAAAASCITLAGCGGEETGAQAGGKDEAVQTAAAGTADNSAAKAGGKTLIVYFSYPENATSPDNVDASARASVRIDESGGVTGNTKIVAEKIQQQTGADIFSIHTVKKYPPVSDYDAAVAEGKQEKESDSRPELASHIGNIDDYDTIFVGYPNWWYDMPMALYTFFDEYDLSGKKIIPFSTSGGSGLSDTVEAIRNLEPGATVEKGLTIGADNVENSDGEIRAWLDDLDY